MPVDRAGRSGDRVKSLAIVLALVMGAMGWGLVVSGEQVTARMPQRTVAVDATWSATLPVDPVAATDAYLQRIPAPVRAAGAAYDATRYPVIAVRVLTLVAATAFILFSGLATQMRGVAERVSTIRPVQDAVVAVQLLAVLFALNLPIDTYAGFVRNRHAGFTAMSYGAWLGDAFVAWAVNSVFYTAGLVAILALMRWRPTRWIPWATMLYVGLSTLYVVLLPAFIEPLFNQFTALADGAQKDMILALARDNGVPATDVFVGDASRQGTLLNAHVSGIAGTARIVLDDNTVATAPASEVRFVMAHEMGHYLLGHAWRSLLLEGLVMGVGFVFVGWGTKRLVARYGQRWTVRDTHDSAALPVFWGLFLLWGFLSLPVTNAISRDHETQADRFGLDASGEPFGLAEFMIRDADAIDAEPPALEEWLLYDHPSVRRRILAAMRWRAAHRQ